jgi:drug/metabolite transporter (DMT)-like permease
MAGLYSLITIPIAVTVLNEHIGSREMIAIILALLGSIALACEKPAAETTTKLVKPI